GDLADEDRERKIPWADADEHAAAAVTKLVCFAGRARQCPRDERAPRLERVIAAEIDRLAHLRHGVIDPPAPLHLHPRRTPTPPPAYPGSCLLPARSSASSRRRGPSRRLPARSSAAARMSNAFAVQAAKPVCAAAMAAATAASFASPTRPITLPSMGERTERSM